MYLVGKELGQFTIPVQRRSSRSYRWPIRVLKRFDLLLRLRVKFGLVSKVIDKC